ncbi:hypothetical protein ACFV3R_28805 [Streptomyces sp. NPDC059740]|uniref:hypothetical protein n=1 Tax=Streptomyces sp. NPDC059740 TaxID=3346926 RepID=UPI00365CCB4F
MSAASPRRPGRRPTRTGRSLPWWAVVLPALAFTALLAPLLAPQSAAAVGTGSRTGGLTHLFAVLVHLLLSRG